MAKFQLELPNELLKQLAQLEQDAPEMLGEMTQAGAEVVHRNVLNNMRKSFSDTKRIEPHLKVTRVYRTHSDDAVNTKVGFYGYFDDGTPAELVALAREYGTNRGEMKKPFFRRAFRKSEIESEMLKVQDKYIPKD